MDYPQHEATYRGFLTMVKLGIINMVFVVLALYAFIEGHNAIAGVVLLVLSVVVPAGVQMMGRRSA
ncbi:MAG: aa3-type cytochrome c oxidase subunit IV [Alphaproteobacteria bacterium]|nr:MAG: aa3-type cytochrome c oxidase subunit IV [Alphaproteobacteria bacterium]